jgi:tRNA threonylcarbamoyladenosine biosynthesis protein TsaB
MKILGFDTCLGAVSAAVRWKDAHGAWVVREAYEEMAAGQAERLMPMIGEVMQEAGFSFANLDRIAVTCGPGSFTGVRVGVAAARALALATGLPVVAATSLAVMAARASVLLASPTDAPIAVAIDARRGGLYVQLFSGDGSQAITSPEALSPEAAAERIGARRPVIVGSGAELLARALAASGRGSAEVALPNLQPHAHTLALMAPVLTPVATVTPLYLRPPDAKPPRDMGLATVE